MYPPNSLLRFAGRDAPALAVVSIAAERGDLPVTFRQLSDRVSAGLPQGDGAQSDYAQVDQSLLLADAPPLTELPAPPGGLGYSGLTPQQRAAFVRWAAKPIDDAPAAFQQLYVANLEIRLFEAEPLPSQTRSELLMLSKAPAWRTRHALSRAILLAFWLAQDGNNLAAWLAEGTAPVELWSVALGCQALLGAPLSSNQLPALLQAWQLPNQALPGNAYAFRLSSLATSLDQEPLAYALTRLGDAARTPQPWRCQHRDLRLSLAQPDVRPVLEPLLADMLTITGKDDATPTPTEPDEPGNDATLQPAHLIVEFGHSRADGFSWALRQAQKQNGFQQLMDEDRHMIYRVPFRRSEMRRFWQLWESVQGWSTARVYRDGRELEKWQVYPYSQYLR